jgi:hypothetical protein
MTNREFDELMPVSSRSEGVKCPFAYLSPRKPVTIEEEDEGLEEVPEKKTFSSSKSVPTLNMTDVPSTQVSAGIITLYHFANLFA